MAVKRSHADGPEQGPPVMTPRWVENADEAQEAALNENPEAVWIIRKPALANRVVRQIRWPSRRSGYLVLIGKPRPEVLPALERRFVRVAYAQAGDILAREELEEVLQSADRRDRFVAGMIDADAKIVTLWRGDLTPLVVPFSAFSPTANGIKPDWNRFAVADYGHTLRFGDYEAAGDSVLYDFDPEFRRKLNKRRRATERTLGASIRRLRQQRQLSRDDFPGISPKTLARIERGEVTHPQPATMKLIADQLHAEPEELGSY